MSSPSFSDLNLDEFEDTVSKSIASEYATHNNLDLKRSIPLESQATSTVEKVDNSIIIESPKDVEYNTKRQKQAENYEIRNEDSKWDSVYRSLDINDNDITTIAEVRNKMLKTTKKMVLQIISIKKTETGYLCNFSDKTGTIQGTLNNNVVKRNRQYLEIGSLVIAHSIPVLSIAQSGNRYLILTDKCVQKVVPC